MIFALQVGRESEDKRFKEAEEVISTYIRSSHLAFRRPPVLDQIMGLGRYLLRRLREY